MNWQAVTRQLEAEWRRLEGADLDLSARPFARSSEELLREARERENQSRPMVDAAIRMYARDGAWPLLSSDEQYFLQKRLYYGWLLVANLSSGRSGSKMSLIAPTGNGPRSLFEWLLIDLWLTLGVPLWFEAQSHYYNGCVAAGVMI